MIWVPDYQLVAVLGAREASAFEDFLQTVVAASRDAAAATTNAVGSR
ncbi:MAG TPA: hypothetical protein PLV41_08475 [Miltoncostaeales bacterium]|jgi:hypothetical protein|nr:hypothetical protein [Miltoncostaeales bacterium]